jgi:hypothetical protein
MSGNLLDPQLVERFREILDQRPGFPLPGGGAAVWPPVLEERQKGWARAPIAEGEQGRDGTEDHMLVTIEYCNQ